MEDGLFSPTSYPSATLTGLYTSGKIRLHPFGNVEWMTGESGGRCRGRAEKTPDEAAAESESDPPAIASIVDSVLADLQPKIFEEVSRKMGKKK